MSQLSIIECYETNDKNICVRTCLYVFVRDSATLRFWNGCDVNVEFDVGFNVRFYLRLFFTIFVHYYFHHFCPLLFFYTTIYIKK